MTFPRFSRLLGLLALLVLSGSIAAAEPAAPWPAAETIRTESARIERLMLRPASGRPAGEIDRRLGRIEDAWAAARPAYARGAADVDTALADYAAAVRSGDGPAAAFARQMVWAGLSGGAGEHALAAIAAGHVEAAGEWLQIRDYSRASGDTSATRALAGMAAGALSPDAARTLVEADLLTVAAAELRLSLGKAQKDAGAGNATLLASDLGRATGMARILHDNLGEGLGAAARDGFLADLARARAGDAGAIRSAEAALQSYAPVALAPAEVTRRARLLRRFTDLVWLDYRNGVRDGAISNQLEYREAAMFRSRAATLLADLAPTMKSREDAARMGALLARMEALIAAREDPEALRPLGEEALALIDRNFGNQVREGGYALAVESLPLALQAMAEAARGGDFEGAEAARLEAYAWFDPDIEQRLVPRAPALALRLEAMFWEGTSDQPGLARLIAAHSAPDRIAAQAKSLLAVMSEAQTLIEAPVSAIGALVQSAGILFREGLEAVLILAALLAALRAEGGDPARYRGAVGLGAGAALGASVALWMTARWLISFSTLTREAIEGGTALIAAVVLVWLTLGLAARGGHVAALRRRLAGGISALGLGILAFFVVFREGFETILFYEALLVDAPSLPVVAGLALGTAAVMLLAWLILAAGRRMPLGVLFKATGVLLGVLAVILTGAGIRGLQTAALIGATPVSWFPQNYELQLWFGLYPVAEALAAQALVLGVFLLAWATRRGLRWAGGAAGRGAGQI